MLIFLAELGDKTQLTAMARAAGSEGGKWTVFAAAAAALVLSTLLAVTFGRVIARVVPEHVVRLLAAILFLAFGFLLLIGALKREAPAPTTLVPPATNGMMMRAVLRIAAEFEEASAADYAALAQEADDPTIRQLLLDLEADERAHLQLMHAAGENHAHAHFDALHRSDLPSGTALQHDVAASDRPILAHALVHEQATMQFYESLAQRTAIPALRRTFAYLAQAEQAHIDRIKMLL